MALSRETLPPSVTRFLASDRSLPEIPLESQPSSFHSRGVEGSSETEFPQALSPRSTRGPPAAGQWPSDSDSDQGRVSPFSDSVFSEQPSSHSSENDSRSISSTFNQIQDFIGVRPSRFPCLFLHCCSVSVAITSSREDWYSHCLAHFEIFEPPRTSICIFCNVSFFNEDPWVSWRERMEHIGDHLENGWNIEQSRPDFQFFKHLWHRGLLSEADYNHVMSYTERPLVDGLRPLDFVPEKTLKSWKRADEIVYVYSRKSEERHQKKVGIKRKIRTKHEDPSKTTGGCTTVGTQSVPQLMKVSHSVSEWPILAKGLEKSISKKPENINLFPSKIQEATHISRRTGEVHRSPPDLISPIADSLDWNSEASDSSSNTSGSAYIQNSYGVDTSRYPNSDNRPDYDTDDDLINPAKYSTRLDDIHNSIYKNSVAMLIESHSQSSFLVTRPHTQDTSAPFPDYLDMLERIKQNIRTLQDIGFCQGKLSFLMADPSRSDVATLSSVPIDKILSLGLSTVAAEVEERKAPQVVQSTHLTSSTSIERMSVTSPSHSSRVVFKPRPNVSSGLSYSITSSSYPHHDNRESQVDLTDVSSLEEYLRAREILLRVPDPWLDSGVKGKDLEAHGIIALRRGNVTVFNHRKRREDKYEPRASASRSADFRKASPTIAVSSRNRGEAKSDFIASKYGSSWNVLIQSCIGILRSLKMELGLEDPTQVVYTTLRVLDLIILSYSRAHISPSEKYTNGIISLRRIFKISGTQAHLSSNTCQSQKCTITLASRTLRCLKDFLDNKQVWVFHGEQTDPQRRNPLFLSTSPEDFADIWGPMWKMTNPGDDTRIIRYDLEHGSIIPLETLKGPDDFGTDLRDDEDLCHWVSNNELQRMGERNITTIISKHKLLIGAKKRIKLEENHECHCEASCITKDLRNASQLRPVGTKMPQRYVDAEAVNGSIGGGITGLQVTYSMVTKVDAGRTFKESLIKRWSHSQQRRNPHVLLKFGAVEMSFCTKNSRRIRLIDLLSTQTILKLIDAIDPIKDQECNAAVKDALNNDPVKLIDIYTDKPDWREEIATLVSSCFETLSDTGIKQETTEPISLFWMYHRDEYIATLPRSSHRWSGLIQDSLDSCAFLVLEEKCLVMEAGRKCQHMSKSGKERAQNDCDPLLESALVVNERLDLPDGLKLVKKGKTKDVTCWDVSKLERGSTFKMGDAGGLEVIMPLSRTRLLVKWFPRNPFKAGFHGFLSRIVEKDPELHHMEYHGEVIKGDPLPISIYVVS